MKRQELKIDKSAMAHAAEERGVGAEIPHPPGIFGKEAASY